MSSSQIAGNYESIKELWGNLEISKKIRGMPSIL
jgi:hypothetical protein